MFGKLESPDVFRRSIPWRWQTGGGAAFAAVVSGGLLAMFGVEYALGPLVAVQLLIVVVAAAAGGLYAGLSATLVLALCHLVLTLPGLFGTASATTIWFPLYAIAIVTIAALVGLLREDLGRIGGDLAAARTMLAAANARIERNKETEAMRAYYDPLTDLPTRRLVADRFGQVVPQARRTSTYAAVVMLDLNRFREVNQSFGHDVGDEVLRQVGQRLRTAMRRGDTVGRLGGNKFVVVLTALADRAGIDTAVQKVRDALAGPITVGRPTRELQVSAAFGSAVFPDDGDDWDALYRVADEALGIAKGPRQIAVGPR